MADVAAYYHRVMRMTMMMMVMVMMTMLMVMMMMLCEEHKHFLELYIQMYFSLQCYIVKK